MCILANMNSYGSLLGSVQIQRGVGTSTNGDGAFGGTVALTSKAPTHQAWGEYQVHTVHSTPITWWCVFLGIAMEALDIRWSLS